MRILVLLFLCVVGSFAQFSSSVTLFLKDKENVDYVWTKCYYSGSFSSFNVAINVRGACPYSIKYYPESGTWTR